VIAGASAVTTIPPASQIVDSLGTVWTLTSGGQIAKNGTVDPATGNVILLLYYNNVIYQETSYINPSGQNDWYVWNGSSWALSSDPRVSTTTTMPPPTFAQTGYTYGAPFVDDTFTGTSLNTSLWNGCMGYTAINNCYTTTTVPTPFSVASNPGVGSNQDQYLDPYPFACSEFPGTGCGNTTGNHLTGGAGGLNMIAAPSTKFSGYTWASGTVTSFGKTLVPSTGGAIQIKAKMPEGSNGAWCALWLLNNGGTSGAPEFDIIDGGVGATTGSVANTSIYTKFFGSTWGGIDVESLTTLGFDVSAGYHTYLFQLVPSTSMTVWVDGVQTFRATQANSGNAIPSSGQFSYQLIMSMQMADAITSAWHTVSDPSGHPGPYTCGIQEVQFYKLP
jgi:hypothetical protein